LTVLAALSLCFALAFLGAGFSGVWIRVALLVAGAATVGVACYYLGASQRLSTAIVSAVVLGTVGILASLYGVYAAYWVGWRGLEKSDFGTEDLEGHRAIWIVFISLLWIPALSSLLAVIVTLVGHSAHRRREV
jgi:hypothetical protein